MDGARSSSTGIIWGDFVTTVHNLFRPGLIGVGINMPLSLTVLGVMVTDPARIIRQ